jgi:hypothetical protein
MRQVLLTQKKVANSVEKTAETLEFIDEEMKEFGTLIKKIDDFY